MRAAVLLLFASLLPGCVGLFDAPCPRHEPTLFATPGVDGVYLQTDPTQAWQSLLVANGNATFELRPPAGWSMSEAASSKGAALHIVTVQPGDGAVQAELKREQSWGKGTCQAIQGGNVIWDFAAPVEGDFAQAGQGVHVMTAGFWENGTLFYTNIAEIDADPAWPKAGWYEWEGADPLPVYVYDEDRPEPSIVWGDPQRVTPAAGTVPGLGYFTTIPGFNEALKGLSTTTTRVVRLAPEEAYTRPGAENHVLYGDAIVFYIKVLDVVDLPCPSGTPAVDCRLNAP